MSLASAGQRVQRRSQPCPSPLHQTHLPEVLVAIATSVVAGIVNFAFGLIPLVGLILLLYRDRLSVIINV